MSGTGPTATGRFLGGASGAGGSGFGTGGPFLPGLAEVFTAGKHLCLRVVEAGIDFRALDGVAGGAAGYEIVGVLLSFSGARDDEIHAHDEGIFKTGAAVQSAILTDIIVALENLTAFFDT